MHIHGSDAMGFTEMHGMSQVPTFTMPAGTQSQQQQQRHRQQQQQQQQQQHAFFQFATEPVCVVSHLPLHHDLSDVQAMALSQSKHNDPKPRLAKDEVDLLESEFQKNSKPSSQRKRDIAAVLKVDIPRINNWFQNRRAKAKQMMRREMDTKPDGFVDESSPSEDQDDGTVSEYYGSSNHSQPLQAYSAAFPAVDHSHRLIVFPVAPAVAHDRSVANSASPSAEEYPSPKSLALSTSGSGSNDAVYAPAFSGYLVAHQAAGASPNHGGSNADSDAASRAFEQQSFGGYIPFPQPLAMNAADMGVLGPVSSYQSELLSLDDVPHLDRDNAAMSGCEAQSMDQNLAGQLASPESANSPASAVSDMRFKSPPPPANIATRRNKGAPAMLNSTALRSYPFGPKTGIDVVGKRVDAPHAIRRIASATGIMPSRVQKPLAVSVPRSPLYFERTKEALMQSLQTAAAATAAATSGALARSASNNVSPVTPHEGAPPIQTSAGDLVIVSGSSDDEPRFPLSETTQYPFFSMETSISTPPGTPGFNGAQTDLQHQLNSKTSWSYMPPNDEALLTPSLGSFGSDEFSTMSSAVPAYVVHSQPATPSFAQSMIPNYFPSRLQLGSALGAAEYAFPGETCLVPSSSTKSSPGRPKAKQFQFTPNVTPQDFFANDK